MNAQRLGIVSSMLVLILSLSFLSACAAKTPEVVEKVVKETVVVEKVVKETVVVEKEVVVEKIVPQEPTVVRFGIQALPVTWDINMSTGSYEWNVLRSIYEAMYDIDFDTYDLLPRGALKHDVSDDGLVYTFYLNPEARWSDGEPVTAHHYVYGLMRLIDPALASPMSFELDMVKGATAYYMGEGPKEEVGIRAVDNVTLEITVAEPASFLPMAATGVWFVPLRQEIVEAQPRDWMLPPHFVGNGPYHITEYVPDQRVVIEKNPHYWRAHRGPDRVEFTIFSDSAASFRAYEAGEIDVSVVPADDLERVKADPVLSKEYYLAPQQGVSWIVFDTTNQNSPVSDKRVRQALSLAIDREAIVAAIFKGARQPAYHLIPDNLWGFNPDAGVKGGVEEARKLLAEAGYPNGAGWPAGVSLHCNNIPDDDFGRGVAEALSGMWKESLGIDVRIEALEYQASEQWWQAQTEPNQFHMFLLGWSVDYPDPYSFYNTCFDSFMSLYNHWRNEEYSRLVVMASAAPTRAEREALYKQAALILEEELPHAPYVYRATPFVYKTWLAGKWIDPTMAFPEFSNIIVQPR